MSSPVLTKVTNSTGGNLQLVVLADTGTAIAIPNGDTAEVEVPIPLCDRHAQFPQSHLECVKADGTVFSVWYQKGEIRYHDKIEWIDNAPVIDIPGGAAGRNIYLTVHDGDILGEVDDG